MTTKNAVILAAGKGQRLDRPDSPKPLVKVGNQPMILWNIRQLQEAGIENIYIVVGYRGDEIKKELFNHPDISANINYIEQDDSSKEGMLKSVMSVKDHINGPFFLLSADVIIEKNPYRFFAFTKKGDDLLIGLVSVDQKQFEHCGALSRVRVSGRYIRAVGRNLENYNGLETGVYFFGKNTLKTLQSLAKKDLTVKDFGGLLQKIAEKNKLKAAILKEGEWFDVNTPATHLRAEIWARKQHAIPITEIKRDLIELDIFSSFHRQKVLKTNIIIKLGLFDSLDKIYVIPKELADAPHFLLTDSIVDKLYGKKVLTGFLRAGYNVRKLVVPAGEKSKSLAEYARLADEIFSSGMNKNSAIVSLGGGVINNLAGVLASTLYRGINLIHLPTTLLAQADAAIDFKQGLNSAKGKNLIGSYYPALVVAIDPKVLVTLSDQHIKNGLAESIKHALTQDAKFLNYLLTNHWRFREIPFLDYVVRKTIEIKAPLLSGDVADDYNEMLPQYGHSVGHALEQLSSYELLHGEALAVGMCVSAEIAKILRICDEETLAAHYEIYDKYNLPTFVPDYISAEDICDAVHYDKHYVKESAHMALIERVGKVWNDKGVYGAPIDEAILKRAININKSKAKQYVQKTK